MCHKEGEVYKGHLNLGKRWWRSLLTLLARHSKKYEIATGGFTPGPEGLLGVLKTREVFSSGLGDYKLTVVTGG